MGLNIDFAFDVGTEEKHRVTFHWGQFWGRILITVDGVEIVVQNRAINLGKTRVRKFEFLVGHPEAHTVVIEKVSKRVFAGARRQKCRAFVDGELVGEY